MGINPENWGEIVLDPNPKKTTAELDIDMKTGNIKSITEHKEETKQTKLARIKEERGRKLGLIK